MPLPLIDPPLLNSANPWCTTKEDLQKLYDSPHTGAVTTRTSLLGGFGHDPSVHQHTFFDPHNHKLKDDDLPDGQIPDENSASLNTLGYSPYRLDYYLRSIIGITQTLDREYNGSKSSVPRGKPFIISVTGSPDDIYQCYDQVSMLQAQIPVPLCVEVNLSCPNIPGKPPPAYSLALLDYLKIISQHRSAQPERQIAVGNKTPPYTYADQYHTLMTALTTSTKDNAGKCPIDFITATNTLGSCLILTEDGDPALASATGAGVGGMAGPPLHPLALGNVKTIRSLLDQCKEKGQLGDADIDIIGVGGVSDSAGFDRMRKVGANIVGVGTALGREGVPVFAKILGLK